MAFQEVSRSHPCPVCGSASWCRVTADGELIHCRKQDTHPTLGAGLKLLDKNKDPYWRYYTRERQADEPPRFSHTIGAETPADAEERHAVYSAFLRCLPARLEVKHELDRRKVPDDSPVRNRCQWLPGKGRAAICRQLVKAGLESLMAKTPGFYVAEGTDDDGKPQRWWSFTGAEGLLIPVYNVVGFIVGLLIRPKELRDPKKKYVWLSSTKKGGAGQSRPPIHIPHKYPLDKTTVRVTEGALKAWVTTELSGMLTLGLPGVHGRTGLIKILGQLGTTTVRIAFDADLVRNRHVALAASDLYQLLTKRTKTRPAGFVVEMERWDEADGKGIDDLLAAGKTPEILTGDDVGTFIADLLAATAHKKPVFVDPFETTAESPSQPAPEGGDRPRPATAAVEPDGRTPPPAPDTASGGRVEMDAEDNHFARVLREVSLILAARDGEVFQKDHQLVEVITPVPLENQEAPAPYIAPLTPSNIRTRIGGFINFMVYPAKGEPKPVYPPEWLGKAVHDANKWPRIRPLVGVSISPVMRPDGSVHQEPGYDPRTGVLYLPLAPFDPIPGSPTREDAKAAVAALWDVVRQFHWKTRADFAVWVCEAVTMAVRYAIPGPVPMFLHTANIFSSGKTLLCNAAAIIGTGRSPPKSNYPVNNRNQDDPEELRKVSVSVAMAGHAAYLFDNIPTGHGFGNHVLDNMLTAENESGRALGTNDTPNRPANTVYQGTGNNVYPIGDTVRRCQIARLHNPFPHPDKETHDGPQVDHLAKERRGQLFTACVVIVSAYIKAGRPRQNIPEMGTFGGWSNLIRSAVVWAGEPDPNETKREYEEENPEQQIVGQLIHLLRLASPSNDSITAGEIIKQVRKQASEDDSENDIHHVRVFPLLEAYQDIFGGKRPDATALGKKFAQFKGRPHISGQSVEKEDNHDRNGVTKWYVGGLTAGVAGVPPNAPPHSPPHSNLCDPNGMGSSAGVAGVVSGVPRVRGEKGDHHGRVGADTPPPVEGNRPSTPATPAPQPNNLPGHNLSCRGECGGGPNGTPAHPSTHAGPPTPERGFI